MGAGLSVWGMLGGDGLRPLGGNGEGAVEYTGLKFRAKDPTGNEFRKSSKYMWYFQ